MMDKIFAVLSMLGVIAFMGVVTVMVMEPDLWIVAILGIGIAIYFLRQELKTGGSHLESPEEND